MAVSFNDISPALRLPLFYAEVDESQAGTFQNYQRALIIAYKTSAGTIPLSTMTRVSSRDRARTLFGAGSHGWAMFDAWFKNNTVDEAWAIAVDPPSAGTAAVFTLTVTGPATASGAIYLYIAGRRVAINVINGDSANDIASAIRSAVTSAEGLPVTAGGASAAVVLTCRWKGVDGNGIDIRWNYRGSLGAEALPAGVGLSVAATTAGVGVPDITDALAELGDLERDTVVLPWTDDATLDAIDAEWDHHGDVGRWSWLRQVYGQTYTAIDGSVGDLQTFGEARNGAHITCFGYNGSPTPAWERAAMYAAQAHRHLMLDPARPLHTLPLRGMLPAALGDRFTKGEKNSLAWDGISCCKETDDGSCLIETSLTMYRKNSSGLDDNAFLKVQTLATLAYVLRSLRYAVVQKFPRHKLGTDGTRYAPGQAIMTPSVARGEIIAHARTLEQRGILENIDVMKKYLIVERSADNPNRLDVVYPPDLIDQLDVFAVLTQFRLQYPAETPEVALAL